MSSAAPNSYEDPYWTQLASAAESKAGLPEGLLTSIVTKGERSNNDQVSEAGAKTPFQITPSSRKAAIDKYGIDPYLSPENAAEVAGMFLKDSLQRNKGDVVAAVSEYHGGTDRANWGPKTRSYVARVLGGQPTYEAAGDGQSTFQRALANQQQNSPPKNAIENVYQAYRSGNMTPEEAREFEEDVKSGLVMLPRGATLGDEQSRSPLAEPEPVLLSQAITDAYTNGKMSEQERSELESDLRAGLVRLPPSIASQVPTDAPGWAPATEQGIIERRPDPTLGQQVVGAGEAGAALITGATTGTLGAVGGTATGITQSILDGTFGTYDALDMVGQKAAEGAQALTRQPRTETGQRYTQNVGEAMANLIPLTPMMGGPMGAGIRQAQPAIQAGARSVAQQGKQGIVTAADATKAGLNRAGQAVANAPGKVAEMTGMKLPKDPPETAASGAVGADVVPLDAIRANKARNLPVPIDLTLGAETRNAAQLAFEKEQMKGQFGAPLRNRADENRVQILQNFDALVDRTGSAVPNDLSATGSAVVRALGGGYQAARNKTNVAYAKARKSPEANAPVDPNAIVAIGEGENAINSSVIGYLNGKISGVPSASVPDTARKIMVKLGLAEEDDYGTLIGRPATVGKMEDFRKELSGTAKWDDRVGIREETILKKLIDAQTEPVAGPLYKEARALRTTQARKYENRAIVARLITNRKGMDDPKVAVDRVFKETVLTGSPEEITFLKRVLLTSGASGKQAWKELQGETIKHIRYEATKGMDTDSADNPIVSPRQLHQTVSALDKNGRLDLMLGKKNADIVRDLNDVVRYVNTVPPETLINNSGTSGALMAALAEAGTTGALTGLPVPVISILRTLRKQIGNNKMKLKIDKALNAKPSTKPTPEKDN